MEQEWGRRASAGTWLSTRRVWTWSAVLLAVVRGIGLAQYRYSRWTPLQQFYLQAYVRSTLLTGLGISKPSQYTLLTVADARGPRLAVDADVAPAAAAAPSLAPFSLTAAAQRAG